MHFCWLLSQHLLIQVLSKFFDPQTILNLYGRSGHIAIYPNVWLLNQPLMMMNIVNIPMFWFFFINLWWWTLLTCVKSQCCDALFGCLGFDDGEAPQACALRTTDPLDPGLRENPPIDTIEGSTSVNHHKSQLFGMGFTGLDHIYPYLISELIGFRWP